MRRPPIGPTTRVRERFGHGPRSSVSLNALASQINRFSASEIRVFFRLKVEGDCDSDAFMQYQEGGIKYSECWHASVQFRPTWLRWISEARAVCDSAVPRIDADAVESLIVLVMAKVTRKRVVDIKEFYLRDAGA